MKKKIINTLILFSIIVYLFSFSSCKTQYVPIETVKTKTEFVEKFNYDTVYDFVFLKIETKADTVYIITEHEYYKEKIRIDTININTVDSIPVIQYIYRDKYTVRDKINSFVDLVILLFAISIIFFLIKTIFLRG